MEIGIENLNIRTNEASLANRYGGVLGNSDKVIIYLSAFANANQ
jgi:hypothetical protein